MVGSPIIVAAFLMALVMCANKHYYQAICFMIGAVYVVDYPTFYLMLMLALVFTFFAHLRAAVSGD